MNATTTTTVATAGTAASKVAPLHVAGTTSGAATPKVELPGSGQTITLPTPRTDDARQVTVPLDQFARKGGPDASVKTDTGVVYVHAVFQMDPTTKEMSVSIVDEAGRLIRMIPPDSVARMIAAMATYRGR